MQLLPTLYVFGQPLQLLLLLDCFQLCFFYFISNSMLLFGGGQVEQLIVFQQPFQFGPFGFMALKSGYGQLRVLLGARQSLEYGRALTVRGFEEGSKVALRK